MTSIENGRRLLSRRNFLLATLGVTGTAAVALKGSRGRDVSIVDEHKVDFLFPNRDELTSQEFAQQFDLILERRGIQGSAPIEKTLVFHTSKDERVLMYRHTRRLSRFRGVEISSISPELADSSTGKVFTQQTYIIGKFEPPSKSTWIRRWPKPNSFPVDETQSSPLENQELLKLAMSLTTEFNWAVANNKIDSKSDQRSLDA